MSFVSLLALWSSLRNQSCLELELFEQCIFSWIIIHPTNTCHRSQMRNIKAKVNCSFCRSNLKFGKKYLSMFSSFWGVPEQAAKSKRCLLPHKLEVVCQQNAVNAMVGPIRRAQPFLVRLKRLSICLPIRLPLKPCLSKKKRHSQRGKLGRDAWHLAAIQQWILECPCTPYPGRCQQPLSVLRASRSRGLISLARRENLTPKMPKDTPAYSCALAISGMRILTTRKPRCTGGAFGRGHQGLWIMPHQFWMLLFSHFPLRGSYHLPSLRPPRLTRQHITAWWHGHCTDCRCRCHCRGEFYIQITRRVIVFFNSIITLTVMRALYIDIFSFE